MRTLIPYHYKHITEPEKLQKYYNELIEYYNDKKENEQQDTDTLILNKLRQSLKDEYLKSAQINSDTNEKKGKYLFYARVSMFASIFSLIICSIIYFSIIPNKELNMSDDNKTTKTQQTEVKQEPKIETGKLKRNEDTTTERRAYEKEEKK